jgi:hypothetical protein
MKFRLCNVKGVNIMAQTMKEIIEGAFSDITESRMCEFLPTIVRDAKGGEFLTVREDSELSNLIRRCLDETSEGGMIGILLPDNGNLRPVAIINRGGILGTEYLDEGSGFGLGNRGKKALAKTLQSIQPVLQPQYVQLLEQSEDDRRKKKEEELKAREAKKREMEEKRLLEEKEKYKEKVLREGDEAFRSLRTGRVFRPEMPEMLMKVMMSQAAAYGALDGKSIDVFENEFKNSEIQTVYVRTAEILDNEIAKRSQMALEALESQEALWDFITGYQEYLSSKKLNFRDKLVAHGDTAFEELYSMDANDDVQLWKIPELLKQIYLGYLAADEDVTENDIEDCKADPLFDKSVELVSNITTMNIRLGTLNQNAGACRSEILRQIEAARKQLAR